MPQNNSKANRERRQREAQERQKTRRQRTPVDQITLLVGRPGFANKETDRLMPLAQEQKRIERLHKDAEADGMPPTPKPKRVRERKPKA